MDAKVSAKFLVLLQRHYLICSIAIFVIQNQEINVLIDMPESWRVPFDTSGSEIVEYILWGSLENESIATCYFKNMITSF